MSGPDGKSFPTLTLISLSFSHFLAHRLSHSPTLPPCARSNPSSLSLSHCLSLPHLSHSLTVSHSPAHAAAVHLSTSFISLALFFSADTPPLTLSIRNPQISNSYPCLSRTMVHPIIENPPFSSYRKPSNSLDSLSVSRQHKGRERRRGGKEEEKRRELEEKNALKTQV